MSKEKKTGVRTRGRAMRRMFIEEYCKDWNASAAAVRAGYSAKTSRAQGSRLLTRVDVQREIEEEMRERTLKAGITVDRIIQEYGKIAFSDITRFVRWDGGEISVVDSKDIDIEHSPALQEVSKTDGGTIKIKLHDKLAALNKLAENLGMAGDKKMSVDLTSSDGSMSPPTEIMLVGPDYDDEGDDEGDGGIDGSDSDDDIEFD